MTRATPCTFTVFTATYNRAHTLRRVYESLARQTFRDFEWLIVDDGSTDETRRLVEAWPGKTFPIRYFTQKHSGKHVAFNKGVREAQGLLFLSLDSDDELMANGLERFKFHWDSIPPERRTCFSAVTALCVDQRGNIVGDPFPQDILDSDSLELQFRYGVAGDKSGFQRTDILRRHPFPELHGLTFVPEGVVWFAIARSYKTRFVNEPLVTVHREAEPHLSALTSSTARGRLFFHRMMLNEYSDVLYRSPRTLMKCLVNYCRYSFACDVPVSSQLSHMNSAACRAALAGVVPLGYALNLKDHLTRNTR